MKTQEPNNVKEKKKVQVLRNNFKDSKKDELKDVAECGS